jgi:CDP-diacylglycerol--serine O-phosphatidyltransferase
MASNQTKEKELNIIKLFPSFLTMAGICVGISAIKFALAEKWELAVTFVVLATIIDALDGKFARALNATSSFGGHLDSLSDFLNFGFTPIFILYLWSMESVSKFGWAAVLFFTACCAIRLARFNTDLDDEENNNDGNKDKKQNGNKEDWRSSFFIGVPSPAGALACLAPLMAVFASETKFSADIDKYILSLKEPIFLICYSAFLAILMASRIPTYSIKRIIVKKSYIYLVFIAVVACLVSLIIQPWTTIIAIGVIYYGLIPISTLHYMKLSNKYSF